MSGRLGDHNLPGVHAFREVLGKNLHLFIYHGGFRPRMKITDKKGMFTGRIQDSPRDGMPTLKSPGKLNEIWSTAPPPRIPTGFWKR